MTGEVVEKISFIPLNCISIPTIWC